MPTPDLRTLLNLLPLPQEGGYYRETYRGALVIDAAALGEAYPSTRNVCTAIYYLLTAETCSQEC